MPYPDLCTARLRSSARRGSDNGPNHGATGRGSNHRTRRPDDGACRHSTTRRNRYPSARRSGYTDSTNTDLPGARYGGARQKGCHLVEPLG